MKPNDYTVAAHEAAHAVAAYILGLEVKKVEVWGDEGLTKMNGRPSERPFDHAVTLLAGGAYLRAMQMPGGDKNDFAKAAFLVEMSVDARPDAAREAFAVVAEAAHALVRTDRFRFLVAKLTPELVMNYWHYGPEVLRFLRDNDPDRKTHTERHSAEPFAPWYEVSSDGRVIWRGASRREAEAIWARTPRALLVGSSI
jgi:hypothetical protein